MPQNGVSIWQRLIIQSWRELTPAAAQAILEVRFPESDVERMNQLAELASAGELTEEDRAEAEEYNRIGHMLTAMHARARVALRGVKAG